MLIDLLSVIFAVIFFSLGRYSRSHEARLQYMKGCTAGWDEASKHYTKARDERGRFVKR